MEDLDKWMIFNAANVCQSSTCNNQSNILNGAYASHMLFVYVPPPYDVVQPIFVKGLDAQFDWKLQEIRCFFVV